MLDKRQLAMLSTSESAKKEVRRGSTLFYFYHSLAMFKIDVGAYQRSTCKGVSRKAT
jgi:hypothetical protein